METHAPGYDPAPRSPSQGDDSVPVILRNTPPGYDWVFYSREEPRMHIQTLPSAAEAGKIWLEEKGRWVIQRSGDVPAKVFRAVKEALESDPMLAWRVRAQWVRQMIVKRWISYRLIGDRVELIAYPGMSHEFTRELELSRHGPPSFYASPEDVRLDPETAAFALGARRPEHEWVLVDLAEILWEHTAA